MKHFFYAILVLIFLIISLPIMSIQAVSPQNVDAPNILSSNNALLLDGSGDYMRVANQAELNPTSAITLEAWVNPVTVSGCHTIFGKNYTLSYWLGICNGKLRFYPHGSGTSVDGSASIPTSVWTHVAVTYDGTTRRYYINGALDLTSSLYPGALTTSTTDLAIGADLNPLSLYEWYGDLDEVRLWTRALTQTEIQSNLYGSSTVGGAGSGLVGYWRLDGSTYDYSYNFGSANNSGVLQDNATFTNTGVEPDNISFTQQAGRTFTMDGICNPAEYAGAYEYRTGFSNTYVIHNVTDVYVCFSGLEKAAGRWASVALDMDFDRGSAPDNQDYLFSIDIDGVESAKTGNGSGWVTFSPPGGFWEAARYNDAANEFTWSAEFRFPATSFGWTPGYSGSSFGVALFEGFTGQQSKAFPGGVNENLPVSWGRGTISAYTAPSVTWSFSGLVLDEQTGGGIASVPVQLFQSTSGGTFLVDTTTTNGSGGYSFSHTGLVGGTFIVQEQDATGYSSVGASVGSDGRVITPNWVSYSATVSGGAYSAATFIDTQNLPEGRTFDRHYIIVYSSPVLYSDLWPLIQMKKLEGYQVEAISTSQIATQTSGYDLAEKIRNYLKARWQTLRPQPIYALLVGRHDLIPVRDLGWLGDVDHRTPGQPNYAPAVVSDWYYADLDSNWDTDGDHFYGEFLYCEPGVYQVPLEGVDLPGPCPPAGSPLREGPYGTSPSTSDDWKPEISLGRLEINDRAEVRRALETSANSESSGSLVKQDALLAGAMWFFNGRSWNPATGAYVDGSGDGINGAWPNPVTRPLGSDSAINLETVIKPGLASLMRQITTLYETASPHAGLIPTSFTPTFGLTPDTFSSTFDNGFGLVNVNGHGNAQGVYRLFWNQDLNNNSKVDNPANPAETASCTGNCNELTWQAYITANTPAAPGPVAPIIFANACSTGEWSRQVTTSGGTTFVADDTAIAGRIPAQGKAAAWIGGLNIVPVYGLDSQQNNFNIDITDKPLLLGDAFWKGMVAGHAAGQWDWRMHTLMLFGDPAYAYWGNPLDTNAYWPESGLNWFNSGTTMVNGPVAGSVVWTGTTGTPKSPPVVNAAGRILVGGQTGLTSYSGDGLTTGSANPGVIDTYSPALATDGVYFAAGPTLYEYTPFLALRRSLSLGGSANGEPRIGPDGIVWVPTTLGMARVTGSTLPEILDGGPALSPAALTLSGAAVWVGNGSTLYGYFMDQNGNITRDTLTISGAGTLTTPVVAPNGDVYVGGSNSILYKIPGGFPFPAAATPVLDADGAIVARPVIGDDGSIYVGTQTGSLYGLNSNGSVRWRYILPGAIQAAPALDPNQLYVVFNSELRVYEPASGGYLWSTPLGDSTGVQSTPVVGADRTLFMTLNNGKLVAIRQTLRIRAPENLRLIPGVNGLTLQWNDTSDNESGFRVEYCVLTGSCQLFTTTQANATQLTISQLKVGEALRFRIQAVGPFGGNGPQSPTDISGYSSEYAYSEYTSITPPAPSVPTNISAAAISAEGIHVAWEYTGPNADLLTGFYVYRSATGGGLYEEVGSTGASTFAFDDSGLTPGGIYYYKVAAETTGGLSNQSASASAQTRTQSLSMPDNFTAVQQDNLSVLLNWQDHASNETGYMVERKLPATDEYVLTALLPANTTTYTDPAALLSEGGIEYRVRAYTASAESGPAYALVTYNVPHNYTVLLPIVVR